MTRIDDDACLPDDDDDDFEFPPPRYRPQWSADLKAATNEVPWIWHGYLAPANITLLTSQWKSGKTTLLSVLLARRAASGTLAGRPLKPGRTAVLCEEFESHWAQRRRVLDFGDEVAFFCRPMCGQRPLPDDWPALIDSLADLGVTGPRQVDLVVIDSLSAFLPPHSETSADRMLDALAPLETLQGLGMAVLLMHHPRKGQTLAGQAARGSGVLTSYVDIVVEMRPYRTRLDNDRRRVLHSWSRHAATPRQLVIEWTADGSDYLPRGDVNDEEFRQHWLHMEVLFATAPAKLTRRDIRDAWAGSAEAPTALTLWRWLERAVAEGRLHRDGTGHRNAPYRYWLPARAAEWAILD